LHRSRLPLDQVDLASPEARPRAVRQLSGRKRRRALGFSSAPSVHFGEAIVARFEEAERAKAILGPPGVQPVLYPIARDWLIAAVRERSCEESPRRQIATRSFDAFEVACPGDERFEECCAGIEAVLERADALLPAFRAMRRAYLDLADI
jgi:hypothetical protein